MSNRFVIPLLLVAAAVLRAGEEPAAPDADSFAWLTGHWRMESDDGTVWEEIWTAPGAGSLAALTRWWEGDRLRMVEVSLIDRDADGTWRLSLRHFGPGLKAAPGAPADAERWPLARRGEREAVFEEPTRAFPRRIVYRRTGDDTLEARLEGADREMRFTFTRAG